MERSSRSHWLPLCSPSSSRARQRSSLLTIGANEVDLREGVWAFSETRVSDDFSRGPAAGRLARRSRVLTSVLKTAAS